MAHLGDHVAAFVDGQMADDEYVAARAHLGSCEHCRAAVRAQRVLKSRMSGLHGHAAPPASLLSVLADPERLRADPPRRSLLDRLLHHRGLRTLVAITGASVTVTAVAYVTGAPVAADGDPVSPPFDQLVASFTTTSDAILTPPAPTSRTETLGVGYRPHDAPALRLDSDSSEAVALLQGALGRERPVMLDLLLKNYDLVLGADSDLGNAAEVVAVRDGVRAASYWISQDTGQLVRTTTYDADGQPIRTSEPAEPAHDPRATLDVVPDSNATIVDTGTGSVAGMITDSSLADLDEEGWPCHDRLAHGMKRVSGAWVGSGSARLISLTYTDGVSALALFEQNGSLDRTTLEGFTAERVGGADVHVRPGNPTVATWADDGVVYTVVTDTDDDRLADAIADLPRHDDAPTGVFGRIGTGIERLTAWADPMR